MAPSAASRTSSSSTAGPVSLAQEGVAEAGCAARRKLDVRPSIARPASTDTLQRLQPKEHAMAYETIIVETKGRVGIVRLNRPNALNALNAQVIEDMRT